MKHLLLIVFIIGLFFLLLLDQSLGTYQGLQGLDTDSSTVISQPDFSTLLANNYQFFFGLYYNGKLVTTTNTYAGIGAGYVSNGVTNIVNGRTILTNARQVNAIHVPKYMTKVDIHQYYITNGKLYSDNIYNQARYPIDRLNTAVANAGLTAGINSVFVVISPNATAFGSGWTSNINTNQAFFNYFASVFPFLGPQLGVITTQADFQAVFGSSYQPKDGNNNPLQIVFADCQSPQDNSATYTAFNGFTTPTFHRYQCGDTNIGGTTVSGNLDYF